MSTNQPSTKRDAGGQDAKTRDGKKTAPVGQKGKLPTGNEAGKK